MRSKIIIKIALKNLWSHRLRTSLTIAGVTIGISAIIFLVSLGYGLEQLVTKNVADFDAFSIIDVPSANISTIGIDQKSIERIQSLGHIVSTAPVINLAGRIHKPDSSSTVETVITAGSKNYWQLSNTTINKGTLPQTKDQIVVNTSVINLLGETETDILNKNIDLSIIIPVDLRSNSNEDIKQADSIPLKVVGFIKDTKAPIVYVNSDLLLTQGVVKFSSLKIKVDDRDNVPITRKLLENNGFSTEYVGDTVSEISQVFSLFRAILAAFGLIALIVAALGMFNTLTISLLERIREIGLFKALGMKNKDVYKLILTESLFIGTCGGIIGLILGVLTGYSIDSILSYLAQRSNSENISIFLTPWYFAAGVALFSILVGFITGWYPSKRAVKINPLDALRYE